MSSATASSTGVPSSPHTATASTSAGQCQRYQEYDSLPSARIGHATSSRATPTSRSRVAAVPATMIAVVPSTGHSAWVPG